MKTCLNVALFAVLWLGAAFAGEPELPEFHLHARPGQWATVRQGDMLLRNVVLDVERHKGELLYTVTETQVQNDQGEFVMMGKSMTWAEEYAWQRERMLRNCLHREEAVLTVAGKQIPCVAAVMKNGVRYFISSEVMGGDMVKSETPSGLSEEDKAANPEMVEFTLLDFGDGLDVSYAMKDDDGRLALSDPALVNPAVGQWVEYEEYAEDPETGEWAAAGRIRQEIVAIDGEGEATAIVIRSVLFDRDGNETKRAEDACDQDDIALSGKLFQAAMRHGGGKVEPGEYTLGGRVIPTVTITGNGFFGMNRVLSPAIPITGTVMEYGYSASPDRPFRKATAFGDASGTY